MIHYTKSSDFKYFLKRISSGMFLDNLFNIILIIGQNTAGERLSQKIDNEAFKSHIT